MFKDTTNLRQGELLTIFCVLRLVGTVPHIGWSTYFAIWLATPAYFANTENQWADEKRHRLAVGLEIAGAVAGFPFLLGGYWRLCHIITFCKPLCSRRDSVATHRATVYSRANYGDEKITLSFPAGWEVTVLAPEATPALAESQRQAAFDQPIGTPRIAEMACAKKSAAIVVDDLSRPTPARELIPFVLRELSAAGVPSSQIRFVVGTGSHRPLTTEEMALKVGADILGGFQVTCHNFMSGELRGMGNLQDGTPVFIDPVVADADFKICLGGVYPHGAVGFGGGSKLILPGVSGFATIFCFHTFYPGRGHGIIENESGQRDGRDVSEDVARLIGLDVIVNSVLNHRCQVAGLFVGDFVAAHRRATAFARKAYGTRIPGELRRQADLLVVNCYPLDSDPIQTGKALWPRPHFERAYTVAINPACDGIDYHGLSDRMSYERFLKKKKAQPAAKFPLPRIGKPDQTLVWSENYPAADFYQSHPRDILFRDWDALLEQLAEKLPANARVALFPFAGIQLLAD